MVTKMQALQAPAAGGDLASRQAYENTVTRMIQTKEAHAEICKREVLILWTDYFKPPHFEKYPHLHQLFNEATKLAGASGTKGSTDAQAVEDLLAKIDEIDTIFKETKQG